MREEPKDPSMGTDSDTKAGRDPSGQFNKQGDMGNQPGQQQKSSSSSSR